MPILIEPLVGSLLADANANLGNEAEQLAAQAELFALRANWSKAISNYTRASLTR